jgi:phage tail-like protein
MGDYAERSDQYHKAAYFQVQISGGAGEKTTDGSWKVVNGGSVRFNEDDGVTPTGSKFREHSLGKYEWDDLVLIGPVTKTRKDMLQWYQDTVKGKDHRRNITVIVLNRDQQIIKQTNFLDCFLTSYRLTELDKEAGEKACEETVTICVGRREDK